MSIQQSHAEVFMHAQFNVHALIKLATRLRDRPCICDLSQKPSNGCLNWAIVISFDDGVEWLFRSPRKYYALNMDTAGALISNEAATLKYIRMNSTIPVPEVFEYSSTPFNEIGVPFILMSKARGVPLSTRGWNSQPHKVPGSHNNPPPCLTSKEKEKVMKQLGEITSKPLHLQFDKIGSIVEEKGIYNVESCLSPGFILYGWDTLQDGFSRGPFAHETNMNNYDTYRSATDRWNDFTTVGSKTNSGNNRLDYVIAGQFLQDMIPSLTKSHKTPKSFGDGFPLYHPDLSTNNIFVDQDCNITCIIDWAFSSSVPVSTPLMTPGLPHPRDDMDPLLVAAFRTGFIDHYFKGIIKMIDTSVWDNAQKIRLFTRLVNLDALQDYEYFVELYALTHKGKRTDIPTIFKEMQNQKVFRDKLMKLIADDRPASETEKEEREYFSHVGPERHAVSKRLTLASKLSRGFVADRRPWHWIEEVTTSHL
ncbi:MAG: hypothetical protein M1834_002603 [Cirrosporium novae-zelandiae]|nr:MAG: hypothetical protein M1834_002603 [Cirrosporium novae-zelandiae]